MVLEEKVGKSRGFWRGFLLTVVTFGLYGIYWNYKAHDEVFEQFQLDKAGEDRGTVFFIVGILVFPVFWVYQYRFVSNVNAARQEIGLGEAVSAGEFLLWATVGILLLFIGPIVGYYKLQASINEVWDAYDAAESAASSGQAPAPPEGSAGPS